MLILHQPKYIHIYICYLGSKQRFQVIAATKCIFSPISNEMFKQLFIIDLVGDSKKDCDKNRQFYCFILVFLLYCPH